MPALPRCHRGWRLERGHLPGAAPLPRLAADQHGTCGACLVAHVPAPPNRPAEATLDQHQEGRPTIADQPAQPTPPRTWSLLDASDGYHDDMQPPRVVRGDATAPQAEGTSRTAPRQKSLAAARAGVPALAPRTSGQRLLPWCGATGAGPTGPLASQHGRPARHADRPFRTPDSL